ncbi:hypothetical protein NQD34_008866 [Periophthalmus magnuspinnatus]|nr:hypothetical protein NQD34_008866 [Periophthalmus magnuspinnatus]
MYSRSKLVVVLVCTLCFGTIWIISSSRLTFEEWGEDEGHTGNMNVEAEMLTANAKKPCSCDRCMTENNYFCMQRYKKFVNPFLTPDGHLTLKDFTWWMSFQHEGGDLKKFEAAKDHLFRVFPSRPDVAEPHPDRCRTCAVVGNSGNMKGSNYGRQIDAHDIVMRMNFGKTAGYEVDVGNKTTHRVMYPESGMDLDDDTHLVLFPFKIMDLQWITEAFTTGFHGRSYAPVQEKINANKNLVMVVNPRFMRYIHTCWLSTRGKYPSTGFMTLVLAMHICDQVDIYGFGADKNGNWNHYYEVLRNRNLKTGVHPGMYEYNLIQELAKKNIVTLNRGW